MTNEQILELAKTCGFDDFSPEDGVYWECWKEQLIEFARRIYQEGVNYEYDRGFDDGWESRADAERALALSKSELVGDPQ